ncbi:MAG: hypothetical protein FJ189_00510 [Gammaproteobacteria bacterium]|nr:hypothetical protein [Gammaproteobacteria bacterium]
MADNEQTEDQQTTLLSPFSRPRAIKGKRSYGPDDESSYNDALALKQFFLNYEALEKMGGTDYVSRSQIAKGNQIVYGAALLDDENYLVRGAYFLDQDTAELQMLKFKPTDLATLAKQMQRTGFYTSGEPSGLILTGRGYSPTDVNAFINLMRYSNQQGLIVQSVAKQLHGLSPVAGEGTKVKVTAEEDIRYYLEQAFFSRMGRKPTRKDIDDGIAAIQANERKMAAMGRSAPSVAVAAKVQAEKGHGAEGAAYQLGNAIKLAFAHLGGG